MIHNIYIINNDGLCALSIKLGSIEVDPDLVAGGFTASQTFWKTVTGEAPQSFTLKDMNVYIKSFSTKEKGWHLVLVTDAETPKIVEEVENTILSAVEEHKELFEKFFANPTDISTTVGDSIMNKLKKIPCPHINQKLLKQVCECSGEQVESLDCNLVSMASCKAKIKDHQEKNSQVTSRATHIFG
jgi:hypothetical protein